MSIITGYLKRCVLIFSLLVTAYLFSTDPCILDHAIVGIYAVDSRTGEVIIDKNSSLSLIPASCMKLATTAAALQLLGEDYRFETHLEYDGSIQPTHTLRGNLYIRGGGDPCLGSDRLAGALPWDKQIERWADAIQNLGIQRIEGKVIEDATQWEKAMAVPSWSWEDLGNAYGAGASALSFHENSYSLFFIPGHRVGEKVSIVRTEPPIPTLLLQNEVKTGPKGSGDCACIYGSEFSSTQFVRGSIPLGEGEFAIKGAIPDPAACATELLTQQLQVRGIVIEQRDLRPQNLRTSIHKTYSPTVGEIVHATNQQSVNLYAEHLLKKMGEVLYGKGSNEAGIKAVKTFWQSQDLDLSGFNMVDGSGLSRKNLITTKQLVGMLLKTKATAYFPLFFESLPQKEGSMKAKSGSMSLIKGYAGYTGHIAFAILVNQCANPQVMNEKINDFLNHLNVLEKTAQPESSDRPVSNPNGPDIKSFLIAQEARPFF